MLKNLLNSICSKIVGVYSTAPIYIQKVPQGFKRPSFYVKYITGDSTIIAKDTYRIDATFQLVYFGEQDEFNEVDVLSALDELDKINKLFSDRLLPVVDSDNRVAKITAFSSEHRDSEIYANISVSIAESNEPIEDTMPMGVVYVNTQK